jgi:hypothetical protein
MLLPALVTLTLTVTIVLPVYRPSDTMAFSIWTEFTVPTGKSDEHPRGMALVTRMLASSEQV